MSVPLGSVQTINVSSCVAQESAKLVREAHSQEDGTLLLLIPIVLGDFCLQEHAVGLVLGLDEYSMLILRKKGFVSDRRKFSGSRDRHCVGRDQRRRDFVHREFALYRSRSLYQTSHYL